MNVCMLHIYHMKPKTVGLFDGRSLKILIKTVCIYVCMYVCMYVCYSHAINVCILFIYIANIILITSTSV